jgi:hypothetical protein
MYFRYDLKLWITILRLYPNHYTLIAYSRYLSFEQFGSLEELWFYLVMHRQIYYFIEDVDHRAVIDKLFTRLQIRELQHIFNYHVYWEHKSIVKYMMNSGLLFQYPTYTDLHTLVSEEKWGCFDMITGHLFNAFDDIFEKLPIDSYSCILELARRLKDNKKLDHNPKIKQYVSEYNKQTMKRIDPFIKYERLPQDLNNLVAGYLLY